MRNPANRMTDANPGHRCARCRLVLCHCLCDLIPRVETRTHVVLILHQMEERKTSNTGRLALRCLPNSTLVIRGAPGHPIEGPVGSKGATPTPCCCFPTRTRGRLTPGAITRARSRWWYPTEPGDKRSGSAGGCQDLSTCPALWLHAPRRRPIACARPGTRSGWPPWRRSRRHWACWRDRPSVTSCCESSMSWSSARCGCDPRPHDIGASVQSSSQRRRPIDRQSGRWVVAPRADTSSDVDFGVEDPRQNVSPISGRGGAQLIDEVLEFRFTAPNSTPNP